MQEALQRIFAARLPELAARLPELVHNQRSTQGNRMLARVQLARDLVEATVQVLCDKRSSESSTRIN